jgi:hypothetical protein
MGQEVSVIVSADDRARLEAIVGNRNQRRKHVQRAQIVLLSTDRLPVAEVARQASVSRPAVWRWQRRFAEQGVSGLLRDKTRPPGTPPLPDRTVARVVAMTCAEPPGEATHWTGRAMAQEAGISLSSVQRGAPGRPPEVAPGSQPRGRARSPAAPGAGVSHADGGLARRRHGCGHDAALGRRWRVAPMPTAPPATRQHESMTEKARLHLSSVSPWSHGWGPFQFQTGFGIAGATWASPCLARPTDDSLGGLESRPARR